LRQGQHMDRVIVVVQLDPATPDLDAVPQDHGLLIGLR
jgi:hypothetical protein